MARLTYSVNPDFTTSFLIQIILYFFNSVHALNKTGLLYIYIIWYHNVEGKLKEINSAILLKINRNVQEREEYI